MIQKRLEVQKTIVLEFSLPGTEWSSASGTGVSQRQMEYHHNEQWSLRINQSNALETATVFEGIAKAIRESML